MRGSDFEIFSKPVYNPDEEAEGHRDSDNPRRRLEYRELDRNSRGPRCCSPRSCCNLKCLFQHIGTSGYSVENAALYADTAYRWMLAAGWVKTMPGLVVSVIVMILVTGWVTLGNYKSYLAIMEKFLSGLPCFSESQKQDILNSLEQDLQEIAEDPSKRFWVFVAVVASIFKAGISIYPLFLVIDGILFWLFSFETSWPAGGLVFIIALLNLFATVAFFNQGNASKKPENQNVSDESEDDDPNSDEDAVELESFQQRVVMMSVDPEAQDPRTNPTDQLALARSDDELNAAPPTGCCRPGCCCNTYRVLQHSGSAGYSMQNAALYSNSAHQFMVTWGWVAAQPKLSYTGLFLGTASVTAANYKSYLAIMDNFLSNFLGISRVNSNATDNSCSRGFWLINTFFATAVKVGISAATLYRLSNRLFYDYFGVIWPSATITGLISAANVIATVGFFRQEIAVSVKRRDSNSERVELLPDDYDEASAIQEKIQLDLSRLY
ncbi:MAG: hypothetical protein K2X50_08795 [Gammaproteobacteria bacterium]|nr:hypothetical protein [Gammaproteobacteria bacterium]